MIKHWILRINSIWMEPTLTDSGIQNDNFRKDMPSISKRDANDVETELRKEMHRKCESVVG